MERNKYNSQTSMKHDINYRESNDRWGENKMRSWRYRNQNAQKCNKFQRKRRKFPEDLLRFSSSNKINVNEIIDDDPYSTNTLEVPKKFDNKKPFKKKRKIKKKQKQIAPAIVDNKVSLVEETKKLDEKAADNITIYNIGNEIRAEGLEDCSTIDNNNNQTSEQIEGNNTDERKSNNEVKMVELDKEVENSKIEIENNEKEIETIGKEEEIIEKEAENNGNEAETIHKCLKTIVKEADNNGKEENINRKDENINEKDGKTIIKDQNTEKKEEENNDKDMKIENSNTEVLNKSNLESLDNKITSIEIKFKDSSNPSSTSEVLSHNSDIPWENYEKLLEKTENDNNSLFKAKDTPIEEQEKTMNTQISMTDIQKEFLFKDFENDKQEWKNLFDSQELSLKDLHFKDSNNSELSLFTPSFTKETDLLKPKNPNENAENSLISDSSEGEMTEGEESEISEDNEGEMNDDYDSEDEDDELTNKIDHFNTEIGSRIKDYEITKVLGEGTFGKVYEGRHIHSEKLFALKVS